jgi:hypothetical protein
LLDLGDDDRRLQAVNVDGVKNSDGNLELTGLEPGLRQALPEYSRAIDKNSSSLIQCWMTLVKMTQK